MKSILAAGLLAALAITPITSAMANVVYTFTGRASVGGDVTIRLATYNEVGENITISGGPSPGPIAQGFPYINDDLIELRVRTFAGEEIATPSYLRGMVNLNLNVDTLGSVTSSAFRFMGDFSDVLLNGTGPSASGFVAYAMSPCQIAERNCTVSGTWELTSVPEPMSLALFGVGLAGLAAVRRRKA